MVEAAAEQDFPDDRQCIGLDTNLFIYFLEDHPRYGAWCAALFDRIERGRNPAVTSTVTLLELLVQPYRDHKEELAQKIFALASTYPKIHWVPVTVTVADHAAELRARYRLSTPDAIQLATALGHKAARFYGNDKALRRVEEIECVILDDLV
ncbi:MAG: PIN domain-containing protein [Nitrospira sp.]|nr:PIN domain-containing protein [Nitrospira sp.]